MVEWEEIRAKVNYCFECKEIKINDNALAYEVLFKTLTLLWVFFYFGKTEAVIILALFNNSTFILSDVIVKL